MRRPATCAKACWAVSTIPLLLAGMLAAQPGEEPAKKAPVPSPNAQAGAEKLVLDIFKEDIDAAKTPNDLLKVATSLLQQGRDRANDAANRYVLLRMARDLSAKAGSATLALTTVEELAREFDISPLDMKADTLAVVVAHISAEEAGKALVDLTLPLIAEAIDADNYEAAIRLGKVAEVAARKSKVIALVAAAQKRSDEVLAVQKGFARLQAFLDRLKQDPDDMQANLELGKYYALLKGKWDKALPYLAKGGDAALKAMASQDLKRPSDAQAQLAVADGWWELAAPQKDPVKLHLQSRAKHWYEKAILSLSGLNRTKALRRIDVVSARLAGSALEGPPGPVGQIKKFEGHTEEVKSVAFSSDGRYGASGSVDQSVRIWDLATGKEEQVLKGHSKQVWGVAFHPNNRQVFSASWDTTARLWDIKTGNEVRRYQHPIDANGIAVSRDGGSILTGCDNHSVYLWNASSGEEIKRFSGHTGFVYGVAFAPDGRHIASGSVDKSARVFDLTTGQQVKAFEGHGNAVTQVAFSPDSRHLFICGDSAAHMWEWNVGKEVRRFGSQTGFVLALAVTPDGRRLVTAGDDKLLRVWDVATGKELAQLKGHTDSVTCLAISADGRRVLSGSMDRSVRLWGLPR
jgi:glutamine cyclotransferase